MSGTMYVLMGILGMGMVNFFIRALPFLRVVPRFVLKRLEAKQAIFPTMFLTLLVLYCFTPVMSVSHREALALIGCASLVAALHWIRGNLVLSLGVGTAVYLCLVNL